jgi:ATP-dependent Clp protease protease subunit
MFQVTTKNPNFSRPEQSEGNDILLRYRAPSIVYVNKFSEESAKEFHEAMIGAQNTGQEIIPVVIDSYGGEIYALLKMIDVIRSSKVPVATICLGKAMSCGAVLLTCGAPGKRFIGPTATVMIHDAASSAFGKVEDIKVEAKEVDRLNRLIFKMMADNCGQPADHFSKIVHEKGHADWYLEPSECLEHRLVDQVKVPRFSLEFDATLVFE